VSAITNDKAWSQQLIEATNIDRLNIGPIPTIQAGLAPAARRDIVDFLFPPGRFRRRSSWSQVVAADCVGAAGK